MTQFDNPYANPYTDPTLQPRKTSGLAVTALVFSLIFCCPVTTFLGPILGLIALVTIGSNPLKKGRGLAWSAVIIGVFLSVAWGGFGFWGYQVYQAFSIPMQHGPLPSMKAGFTGDMTGFKAGFFGQAASASDDDAKKYIETLRARFGEFRNCHLDEAAVNARGVNFEGMMQPIQTQPYVFQFANKVVKGEVELTWVDPQTQQFLWDVKFGRMVLKDPDTDEEIIYPPGSQPTVNPSRPGRPSRRSGPASPSSTAPAQTSPTDAESDDGG